MTFFNLICVLTILSNHFPKATQQPVIGSRPTSSDFVTELPAASIEPITNQTLTATEDVISRKNQSTPNTQSSTNSYSNSTAESTRLESAAKNSSSNENTREFERLQKWFNHQFRLCNGILFWWNVIISPIGILGNVICIVVVSQKHNRGVSCSIYMGALAVADTLMLFGNLGQIILYFPLKFLAFPVFNILCKIDYHLMHTGVYSGVLIILAMLAERVIAITKPLQAARLLSSKRSVYICIGICIFCAIYNIPRSFVTSSTVSDRAKGVGAHCSLQTSNLAVGYHMTSFIAMGVIPLVAIFIMNAVILRAVKGAQKKIARHTAYEDSSENVSATTRTSVPDSMNDPNTTASDKCDATGENNQPIKAVSPGRLEQRASSNSAQRARERRERQLTLMTIVMTTVFLVCNVPRSVHFVIFAEIAAGDSLERYVHYLWSASTTSNLMVLNSAINFYLYVMTGSRFRADAIRLLSCKRE